MKTTFLYLIILALCFNAHGQGNTDSLKSSAWKGQLELGAYIESYYIFDFNQPENGNRPSFLYNHHRHNEFNINLATAKLNYSAQRIRANVAFMVGTYANANLVNEPGTLKNIFEANVGIKLSKRKQLWLDAGIFPSHIGFESAIGKDCWNMTRSILAENSPYYESGVKLTYASDNEKFLASGLMLNGWQRIQRVGGNSLPSFGWQIQGKPNDKILINSSSYIGTDKPDSLRQMRYFHNLYAIVNVTDNLAITLGFDVGAEQKAFESKEYNVWYSPVFIARWSATPKLAFAARVEYYSDKGGAIVATGTPNGFGTLGYSLNVDFIPFENVLVRLEGRLLQSTSDDIFEKKNGQFTHLSPSLGGSLSYSFGRKF